MKNESLDQDQIEALLNQIGSSSESSEDVQDTRDFKTVDFSKMSFLTKDEIGRLMHDFFNSYNLANISKILTAGIHMFLGYIEEITFEEFLRSSPEDPSPSVFVSAELLPLPGEVFLMIPGNLAGIICETNLLYSVQRNFSLEEFDKKLEEIKTERHYVPDLNNEDLKFLVKISKILFDCIAKEAVKKIQLTPKIKNVFTNMQNIVKAAKIEKSSPGILLAYKVEGVSTMETDSFINIFIPKETILSHDGILLDRKRPTVFNPEFAAKALNQTNPVMNSKVVLNVELASAERKLSEIADIEEGKIIQFDEIKRTTFPILLDKIPVAQGEVIVKDGFLAIVVTEVLESLSAGFEIDLEKQSKWKTDSTDLKTESSNDKKNYSLFDDVPVKISVSAGFAEIKIKDLLMLKAGDVIVTNHDIRENVAFCVNGKKIAQGEFLLLDEDDYYRAYYAIRISKVLK